MQKKYLLLIIIITALCLSGFSTHRIMRNTAAGNSANNSTGNIVTVVRGTIRDSVTAVGNIAPKQLIEVKSPISGTVAELYHDYGDYVKAGDPLLEIQPQPTPVDFATAKQQVAEDLVAEQTALQDVSRYQFLLKNGAISNDDQDYANAQKTYATAKLTRELDQQKLALISKGKVSVNSGNIANIVVAPINGYILQRNVDLGGSVTGQSTAQAGDTLFTIANMNDLLFQGQVSEIDVAKIHKNMPADLSIVALPSVAIKGVLTNISLQSVQAGVDTAPQTNNSSSSSPFNVGFDVWITDLQIPKNIHLLAGYSATADITVRIANNTLLLPERALQYDGDKTFVSIYTGKNKPLQKQYVTVGITDGINAQILTGLSAGQQVQVVMPSNNSF